MPPTALALAVTLLGTALVEPSPGNASAAAAAEVFASGFELGTTCEWSSTTSGSCQPDVLEPNGDVATATDLGVLSDCDETSIGGRLARNCDVDFFTFSGEDDLCSVAPFVELTADAGVEICMFFNCASGTTEATCPAYAGAATSPAGDPGCCAASATFLQIGVNCSGTFSDDARVWVRLGAPDGECLDYVVNVGF